MNRLLVCLTVLLCMPVGTGCTFLIDRAARRAVERQVGKVEFSVNAGGAFEACLESPGGICDGAPKDELEASRLLLDPPPSRGEPTLWSSASPRPRIDTKRAAFSDQVTVASADLAREVLEHPVQQQLDALFNVARGAVPRNLPDGAFTTTRTDAKTEARMELNLAEFVEYQKLIESATLLGAWDALNREAEVLKVGDDRERCKRAYIHHYFKAYFRGGKFFQATVSGAELLEQAKERLKTTIPGIDDAQAGKLARQLFKNLDFDQDGQKVFGTIASSGFVTRGGQTHQFPVLEARIELGESRITRTDVDYVAVGSDLIRVLLHALYDASNGLPAVSIATGVGIAECPLPVNGPATGVDEDDFEKIETRSTEVEGVVSAGAGRLIRGVSFLSLNNEAVASAIETAVGVAVRKQFEKVMWCWYACGFAKALPVGDYAALSRGEKVSVEITMEGIGAWRGQGR